MNIPVVIQEYADQEDAARHHSASPENLRILDSYQRVFDAAIDAHIARKVGSLQEAITPLIEIAGLIPADPVRDRDYLTARNT